MRRHTRRGIGVRVARFPISSNITQRRLRSYAQPCAREATNPDSLPAMGRACLVLDRTWLQAVSQRRGVDSPGASA